MSKLLWILAPLAVVAALAAPEVFESSSSGNAVAVDPLTNGQGQDAASLQQEGSVRSPAEDRLPSAPPESDAGSNAKPDRDPEIVDQALAEADVSKARPPRSGKKPSSKEGTGRQPSATSAPEDAEVVFFSPAQGEEVVEYEVPDTSDPIEFPEDPFDSIPQGSWPESSPAVSRDANTIRATFYYPWFPEAWRQDGVFPYTRFTPSLGYYDSGDLTVIRQHIDAMQYGHIDAGISSWWGQNDHTDVKFARMLQASSGTDFRWAIYYEMEGFGDPTVEQIRSDLRYLESRYSRHDGFLRVDGRFVVFVYGDTEDECEMANRWREGSIFSAYLVLKAFPGYKACENQPDGWHVYNPLVSVSNLGSDSYAITPGFAKLGEPDALPRDLERWESLVATMARSSARFQLVTTFNEWGEGTSVEAAEEWPSASGYGAYLDVLHAYP